MPSNKNNLRILILWSRPSGYMQSCLNTLSKINKTEVLFIGQTPDINEAPYEFKQNSNGYTSFYLKRPIRIKWLIRKALDFAPNIILSGGSWRETAYLFLLLKFRTKACRVVCMDTQWVGSYRQRLFLPFFRLARRLLYDRAFVAGNRQKEYAIRLGFKSSNIKTGLYSCDHYSFSMAAGFAGEVRYHKPSFLYVGRLIDIKGILELIEGYSMYRHSTKNPWPLYVCGTGPLKEVLLKNKEINYIGFVQPKMLPNLMAKHTVLIAPSRIEPWGVVLHEGASAGLILISSKNFGASDDLIRSGFNGFILDEVDVRSIRDTLIKVSNYSADRLKFMSESSRKLATFNSPLEWAKRVLDFNFN